MDGWTAARKLKTNPKAVSNPLLALTAHSLPSDRNPTFESGYIGFISKPINI
jgi:CheY-like chemotaxis protein